MKKSLFWIAIIAAFATVSFVLSVARAEEFRFGQTQSYCKIKADADDLAAILAKNGDADAYVAGPNTCFFFPRPFPVALIEPAGPAKNGLRVMRAKLPWDEKTVVYVIMDDEGKDA